MARRKKPWKVPGRPTERKLRNRKMQAIVYRDDVATRFGWLVEETPRTMRLAFPKSERVMVVRGEDRRHVIPLEEWRAENARRMSE